MSKLQREIEANKAQLTIPEDKKAKRKALVDNLLDTVSGGWTNLYADFTKRF